MICVVYLYSKSYYMTTNQKIIFSTILTKMSGTLEELSSNEFVEEVNDIIFKETGKEYEHDEMKDMIGEVMIPFTHLFTKFSKEFVSD